MFWLVIVLYKVKLHPVYIHFIYVRNQVVVYIAIFARGTIRLVQTVNPRAGDPWGPAGNQQFVELYVLFSTHTFVLY